jgi:hypothetical protein
MSPGWGCTPSAEKVNIFHFSLMASSSKPGPSLEQRLGEMQMDLINLKAMVREKERGVLYNNLVGEKIYELLIQDIKNLCEDLTFDS